MAQARGLPAAHQAAKWAEVAMLHGPVITIQTQPFGRGAGSQPCKARRLRRRRMAPPHAGFHPDRTGVLPHWAVNLSGPLLFGPDRAVRTGKGAEHPKVAGSFRAMAPVLQHRAAQEK